LRRSSKREIKALVRTFMAFARTARPGTNDKAGTAEFLRVLVPEHLPLAQEDDPSGT
jgi:hypothetical protein